MLVRSRTSRIYYLRQFFDYPITLSRRTLRNLGFRRTLRIGLSYLRSMIAPIRNEQNLEQFFINRFGRRLYETFFKSYTEKVWGVPCSQISAKWGAQRIKGLDVRAALLHAVRRMLRGRRAGADIAQKDTETSLIEQFLYPKYGPGQMWETVAAKVRGLGGQILTEHNVVQLHADADRILSVDAVDTATGQRHTFTGDWCFSTMPIRDLVAAMDADVPPPVRQIAEGLIYRDYITVGLLLDELKIKPESHEQGKLIGDNWIYIQEPDVLVGRLQIFNNWSPYMVRDPAKVWVGLEYFCNESDDLWQQPDDRMIALAKDELERINIIDRSTVRDAVVIRMPKTYPAYFGTYDRFGELREYLDGFENLFLIGRNGMHRYNNQDHSMLAAMVAVDNILAGRRDKSNIWAVNTEQDYHEHKS